MGGGNGQKSKMARERNIEKQKAAKGSQLESNKKAMTNPVQGVHADIRMTGSLLVTVFYKCKVCMQTFICTTTEVKCREHAEAKHAKSDVYACFPHLKNDAGSVKQCVNILVNCLDAPPMYTWMVLRFIF